MKYLVANWKMKLTIAESVDLARHAREWYEASAHPPFALIICPSPCAIPAVADALKGSTIGLGAQDVAEEERASLTGATSPLHLKELGVHTVIVGHSERRAKYGETDALVGKKAAMAIAAGLQAILCVGETEAERAAGQAEEVVRRQVRLELSQISSLPRTSALRHEDDNTPHALIAYEPVWTIGTGTPVTIADAHAQAAVIRDELRAVRQGEGAAVPLLYGGSVDQRNVASFTVDPLAGTLVGTASQTREGLQGLVEALKNVYH